MVASSTRSKYFDGFPQCQCKNGCNEWITNLVDMVLWCACEACMLTMS